MKKILFIFLFAVIVAIVWILTKNNNGEVVLPTNSPDSSVSVSPVPSTDINRSNSTPSMRENLVVYTDSGYSPSTIIIKKGENVMWKNESSRLMWTASALHPTHKVYPETDIGLCGKATSFLMFDSCVGVNPNQNWSFVFDNIGTWKYHNHSNPSHTGTVVVE
ncbi:MAG: hypothetical protein COV30_02280 [Candidatus Yanofskybacteria bacterium CG10_big_fil_rev_8_21_14_0_10_37_15]|uniref:Plastocyanin n=1 Tax=Candidatus Yanofskybacteria bacterium CG10_big_fil_rev_8_21_14_0_10_37_15 TaxID=1975097 RepID=A0A2H0R6P4_9BACT|nr:MAG: hypothetical protein COV30_02280 [Candidatus Yanofskybacteria bacterium CG10_big_fil_rev_8_21_14_0_10_37_15]